jgi:3-methyladenine DNA glycosylase/8-oxoguanine DNA glycosylase
VSAARAARPAAGSAGETVLPLSWPIDLALTVASHGWVHLAPWRWDPDTATLARSERVGGRLGMIAIAQPDPTSVSVRGDGFGPAQTPEILRRVGRWLSADWEPAAAIAALGADSPAAALIARGGGRLLRSSTFYEDFAKTVLTINTAWSSTCRMAAALVAEPGGGAFPEPGAVLDYGEERLRCEARLGFRAATLTAATGRMLEDGAITPSGEGGPERLGHDYLLSLKGIGPYAAAHCRVLLHDFARIPIDSVVTAHLRERHGIAPEAFAASRAAWGPYLALGYRLLRLGEKLAAGSVPPVSAPREPVSRPPRRASAARNRRPESTP